MPAKTIGTLVYALLLTAATSTAHAASGVKDVSLSPVVSKFDNPPTITMRHDGAKYSMVKEGSYYIKYRIKAESTVMGTRLHKGFVRINYPGAAYLYTWPAGYETKDLDKEESNYLTWQLLAPLEQASAEFCDRYGGSETVTKVFNVPLEFQVFSLTGDPNFGKATAQYPGAIICEPKKHGRVPPVVKVLGVKLYANHSSQSCPRNVVLTTEVWTEKPGKVEFQLIRQDGEIQNVAVETSSKDGLAVKFWAKSYHFTKSVDRKYMVTLKGHKFSSDWVPIKVQCGATNDHGAPQGVSGGSQPTHGGFIPGVVNPMAPKPQYVPGVVNPMGLKPPAYNPGVVQPMAPKKTYTPGVVNPMAVKKPELSQPARTLHIGKNLKK